MTKVWPVKSLIGKLYEMLSSFLKKMEGSKDVSLFLVLPVEVLRSDVIPGAAAVIL